MMVYKSGFDLTATYLTLTRVVFELLERQKEGIAIANLTLTRVVFEFDYTSKIIYILYI